MLSASQALALASLKQDPAHHLRLGLRELIWSDFGKRATAANYLNDAHRKRIALAIAGVVHVLPLWACRFEDNDIPQAALSTVKALVGGEQPDAAAIFDRLWGDVVHLSVERPFPEVAVGFAAVQALSTAMHDEFFDSARLDPEREDEDDPESHDSSYYASIAAAGGSPSDNQSSPERRMAFWNWWLTEGVERATK